MIRRRYNAGTPRRVCTSSARRPYADEQLLAVTMGIAIVAAMAFAGWLGYVIGSTR